jgi:hypothetical protein
MIIFKEHKKNETRIRIGGKIIDLEHSHNVETNGKEIWVNPLSLRSGTILHNGSYTGCIQWAMNYLQNYPELKFVQ